MGQARAALAPGAKAPDFTLLQDGGRPVSLADFKGRNLVLYFFPRADTEGCIKEAMDFSALSRSFAAARTAVLGVSADSLKKQDAFKAKHKLTISLGSDETRTTLDAYGVWVEKSMYGRKYMGIARRTFLIGADGRIARIWEKVAVKGHAEEVLAAVKAL